MQSHVVDAGPLIRGLCDQLELVHIIDDAVAWDPARSKLSPGERILALILCRFMRQRPLYRVHESFRRTDIALLLGKGVAIDDLNDDGFGHALDKLYDAGPAAVYSAVCARATLLENVQHNFIHWDSTSRSFFGEYAGSDDDPLITYGHSKDHRPDLKQMMLTLLTNREGMPLWGSIERGNASDKKLNGEILDQIRDAFSPQRLLAMTYVADSAFVTRANLAKAHAIGLGFLSRLPETFSAAGEVKQSAFNADAWQEIGKVAARSQASSYQASEQHATIDDIPYRLVVYRSSQLEKRKEKSFQKDLADEQERLKHEAAEIYRQPFACREDAEAKGKWWLKTTKNAFHATDFTIQEESVRDKRQPGRPKRGAEAAYHFQYRMIGTIGALKENVVLHERQRRSAFVLITTSPEDKMSARGLLEEYKQQGTIERRFAFMKDHEIVDSFFLKRPERIEALGYVLLMVVLLFSILERRARQTALPLPTLSRGQLINPTGLEILRNLSVSVIEMDDGARQLSAHIGFRPVLDAILSMARVDPRVYTELPLRSTT